MKTGSRMLSFPFTFFFTASYVENIFTAERLKQSQYAILSQGCEEFEYYTLSVNMMAAIPSSLVGFLSNILCSRPTIKSTMLYSEDCS